TETHPGSTESPLFCCLARCRNVALEIPRAGSVVIRSHAAGDLAGDDPWSRTTGAITMIPEAARPTNAVGRRRCLLAIRMHGAVQRMHRSTTVPGAAWRGNR